MHKKCNLLGKTKEVKAPTALPKAMESAVPGPRESSPKNEAAYNRDAGCCAACPPGYTSSHMATAGGQSPKKGDQCSVLARTPRARGQPTTRESRRPAAFLFFCVFFYTLFLHATHGIPTCNNTCNTCNDTHTHKNTFCTTITYRHHAPLDHVHQNHHRVHGHQTHGHHPGHQNHHDHHRARHHGHHPRC